MTYTQLTSEDRYTISSLRKQGFGPTEIAKKLKRHRSTIYREINRNKCTDNHYRPFKAVSRTSGRRSRSRRNHQFTHDDYKIVNKYLRKKMESKANFRNTLY